MSARRTTWSKNSLRRGELYFLDKRFAEEAKERKAKAIEEQKKIDDIIDELFGYTSYEEERVSNR